KVQLANIQEGIVYSQETTYGQRRSTANDLLTKYRTRLNVPLLLDAPCNQWNKKFGPGANITYLIDKDGTVYSKYTAVLEDTTQLKTNIESLIRKTKPADSTGNAVTPGSGAFSIQIDSDNLSDTAGKHLEFTGMIMNSTKWPVTVHV